TQEWEDEQARQRIEGARRGAGKLDAEAQQDKLQRTIELEALQARSLQDVTLHADERRAGLGEAARAGERAHEIALARLAMERAA
ncbi:MAG: hypothetical protein RR763_18455, partial [Massilia sp.]